MPIGKVWIYRLLFFVCVSVRLRIYQRKIKLGVKLCKAVHRRPRQGISHLPHKKQFSAPSPTVAIARIVPKICASPASGSQYSKFHLNQFTFVELIAERVNAVLLAHRLFAIFTLGRIIIICNIRKNPPASPCVSGSISNTFKFFKILGINISDNLHCDALCAKVASRLL